MGGMIVTMSGNRGNMSLTKTIGITLSALLTTAVIGSGCTSREEEQNPAASVLNTESGFCKRMGELICNKNVVEACYLSDDDSLEADTESCVAAAAQNACNPNNQTYDKTAANPCLTAVKALYDDAKLETVELEEARVACLAALHGDGGSGASCMFDEDCDGSEDLRCVTKPGQEGSCRVPEEVEPAADCSSAAAVCPDDLFCDEGEHCVARQEPPDSCSPTSLCIETAQCLSDVCVDKAANGETCQSESECLGGFCIKQTGAAQGQCGAFIPVTFDSAACATLGS